MAQLREGRRGPAGRAQPALFGLAALCFLLPFADVSCGPTTTNETSLVDELQLDVPDEDERLAFRGYELVIGKHLPDDLARGAEALGLDGRAHHFASEPFAVLALVAAVAGAALSLLLPAGSRALGGLVAGLSGLACLLLLGISPIIRVLGAFRVTWRLGYWACLVLFAAGTAVSIVLRRDGARTRLQAPPLDGGGL